jgi:sugar-specific transcriptional regulator TrmB
MDELEETFEDIDELDLNSYELKIWKTLLRNGISTAGELSEQTDVPRSRSYDVLESLEKKGFVVQQIGKPIRYIAIPPEEVLRRIKGQVREEADDRVDHLDNLKGSSILSELQELYEADMDPDGPDDIIDHSSSHQAAKKNLASLIRNADQTVRIVTHHPEIYEDTSFTNAFNSLNHRDITVHILTSAPIDADLPDNVTITQHEVKAEFALVDEADAFIYITSPDQAEAKGMALSAPFFTSSLLALFEDAWAAATK